MESSSNNNPVVSFFKSFFKDCYQEACINLRFIQKDGTVIGNEFIPISELNRITSILERHKCTNSYFGIATRGDGFGGKDGIIEIPYVWVDIDRKDFTPEGWEKLLQNIKEFPLRPTWIIDSGGGLHIYWRLKETLGEEDIPKVEDVLKKFAHYLGGDRNACDASRVLRIPGTLNYKYDPPRPCTILEMNPECQYELDGFEIVPEGEKQPSFEDTNETKRGNEQRLDRIMQCAFLQHCDKDRTTLSEPEWYNMIGALAREPGGPALIHSLSKGYPKYSEKETDDKILHWVNASGPVTCKKINELRDPKNPTWTCPENCKVKSPVGLGNKRNDQELETYRFPRERGRGLFQILEGPLEEPEYLIKPIMQAGDKGFQVSSYKVGKTLLAIQEALSLSKGISFLGLEVPKPRKVLFIRFELSWKRFNKRLRMMNMGLNYHQPYQIEPVFELVRGFDILTQRDFDWLIRMIDTHQPALLILDPFYKICNLDLKDTSSAMPLIRRFESIRERYTELCLLFNAHQVKNSKSRKDNDWDSTYGPMQFFADMDFEIRIRSQNRESLDPDFIIDYISNDEGIAPICLKRNKDTLLYYVVEKTKNASDVELNDQLIQVLSGKTRQPVNSIMGELGKGKIKAGEKRVRNVLKNPKVFLEEDVWVERVEKDGRKRRKKQKVYSLRNTDDT